jgi:hypothetical protein
VAVDACHLDLISRAGHVDEIVEEDDLLVTRQTPGRNTSR